MVDLKDYLQNVKEKIKAGLGDNARLSGNVVLELSTTIETKTGAVLNIQVVELGAKVNAVEVQKIIVPFRLLTPLDKETEQADIAQEKARLEIALTNAKAEKVMREPPVIAVV